MDEHVAWVRPWTARDAGTVERLAEQGPELWEQLPPRERLLDAFYTPTNGTDGRWKFAVCDASGPVGNVALRLTGMGNATCSYWLAPAARGRGLAARATVFLTDFAFAHLDVFRVELSHRADNHASASVARRCGFTFEGIRRSELLVGGVRYDTHLWSLLRTDRPAQPHALAQRQPASH